MIGIIISENDDNWGPPLKGRRMSYSVFTIGGPIG